jgi:hypothetical protein
MGSWFAVGEQRNGSLYEQLGTDAAKTGNGGEVAGRGDGQILGAADAVGHEQASGAGTDTFDVGEGGAHGQ